MCGKSARTPVSPSVGAGCVMKEILDYVQDIREKAHSIGEEVSTLMGIKPDEMPAGVFAILFNYSTILLELLSHYFDAWSKKTNTRCSTVEEAKKENEERVVSMQKMIFIQMLSAIEYSFKDYVKQNPMKIGKFNKRIYLKKIMEVSKKENIISDSIFKMWEGVIELRNTLVHNNGISEKTETYNYPECKIEFSANNNDTREFKIISSFNNMAIDRFQRMDC